MTALRVIGIDPGPIPGLVRLDYEDGRLVAADVVQCTHTAAPDLFEALLSPVPPRLLVGMERFVTGRRAGRSGTARASETTRDLIGRLIQAGAAVRAPDWHARAAGEVKPWATDERLEAAGLIDLTKGMRHARDAARHALFCAVKDGGVPDPLSKHAQPTTEEH